MEEIFKELLQRTGKEIVVDNMIDIINPHVIMKNNEFLLKEQVNVKKYQN